MGELSDLVDIRILVDDHSSDCTVELAQLLGLAVFVHDRNYGYGRQARLFLLWCGERLRCAWLVYWDKNWASQHPTLRWTWAPKPTPVLTQPGPWGLRPLVP